MGQLETIQESTALIAFLVATVVCAIIFLRKKPIAIAVFIVIAGLPLLFGSVSGSLITSLLAFSVVMAQPLYVVLGLITIACFHFMGDQIPRYSTLLGEHIYSLTGKEVLLAIPFFVVSGAIMTTGGIAKRLINLATDLTSWLPGGLGIAAIGGCVFFAAISGSSPVTVIAIGGMMYPALVKAGFSERNSIGLLTSAGSLGIVIPPSIPMIIYAIVVSGVASKPIDVGDLFLAGVGPGLLIGLLFASYVIWQALKKSQNRAEDIRSMLKGFGIIAIPLVIGQAVAMAGFVWGYLLGPALLFLMAIGFAWKAFTEGFWALMLPLIILGGIYSGAATATEAAAVAVVYSLVAAIYIYRELEWKQLPGLITESTVLMGALIVIMVIAFAFNDYLVDAEVADKALKMLPPDLPQWQLLIVLNIFLLIVGCFMDIISAILIVAPLLVPLAMNVGVDPIHLGIIFIVNLELGYLTPPLGLNLFVAGTLFKKPIGEVVRSVIPYTLLMLVGILVVTYVPSLSLGPGRVFAELRASNSEEGAADKRPPVQSLQEMINEVENEDEYEEDEDDWDDDDFDDVDSKDDASEGNEKSPSVEEPKDPAPEPQDESTEPTKTP